MVTSFKDEVRRLLIADNYKEALFIIRKKIIVYDNDYLLNQLTLLEADYNSLKNAYINGLIEWNIWHLKKNGLNERILLLVEDIQGKLCEFDG